MDDATRFPQGLSLVPEEICEGVGADYAAVGVHEDEDGVAGVGEGGDLIVDCPGVVGEVCCWREGEFVHGGWEAWAEDMVETVGFEG